MRRRRRKNASPMFDGLLKSTTFDLSYEVSYVVIFIIFYIFMLLHDKLQIFEVSCEEKSTFFF